MKRIAIPILLAGLLATSCSTSRYPGERYPDGRDFPGSERSDEQRRGDRDRDWERRGDDRGDRGRGSDGRDYPFSALNIPRGHLPPPGECKVWFPGKPPGHQPPPQSCAAAMRSAPLGAWVITHEGSRYRVSIFNSNKRHIIDEVRYYLAQ